jgi:hypothetical protein
VGGQDQDGGLLELARHVLEQQERGLVGGMQVVQDDEHGSLRRQRGEDGRHGVEQHDASLVRRLQGQVGYPGAGRQAGGELRQ